MGSIPATRTIHSFLCNNSRISCGCYSFTSTGPALRAKTANFDLVTEGLVPGGFSDVVEAALDGGVIDGRDSAALEAGKVMVVTVEVVGQLDEPFTPGDNILDDA